MGLHFSVTCLYMKISAEALDGFIFILIFFFSFRDCSTALTAYRSQELIIWFATSVHLKNGADPQQNSAATRSKSLHIFRAGSCTQRLRLGFSTVCIMCVNKLLNYLIIYWQISWDLFGLFFVNILFSVVCFTALVFDQLYSKSYPAYSSSPWNVTSCFFIAPRNLIAT